MNRTRLFVPVALLVAAALTPAHAQFSDFGKKLRDKVEQKVEQRIDRKTNQAVDKGLELVDDVRRARALALLRAGGAVVEVAWLVGYSEPSPFVRAVKRWTGVSPGVVRGCSNFRPPATQTH